MSETNYRELFHFASQAFEPETFYVTNFQGTEGLNTLFCFDIELVSKDAAIDTDKLLNAPAVFSIHRDNGKDAVFHGYLSRVEQGGMFNGYAYYKVELRPAFWKFTQVVQSAIFLNKTVQQVAEELVNGEQFFRLPHEFRFTRQDYPAQEFAMQYGESIYEYILWRMEEQGAYFYFAENSDRIIFADTPQSHATSSVRVTYSPTSGLEGNHREEVLIDFTLAQTPLPKRVVVRTFDWKNPEKVVLGSADVASDGLGDVHLTDENVESDDEATRIAKIRAEELVCRSRVFSGAGSVPCLRPGVVFTLEAHYNDKFNRDYLVTEISHQGSQESFLTLGLGIPLREKREHLFYRNTFSCIASDVPYRPARKASRAKISGVIRAFVDGAGSGARAEMDSFGRYKILFPFDISGRSAGNASCWIRMAQPQVGKDSGLGFPLLPGTEVTVAFLGGNPDRPVITGALANGGTGSITGQGNVNFSGIRTPGGNQITFNDTDNKQGISLLSASGLGLSFADGSPNTSTWTTDNAISAAGLCSNDLTGMCKNLYSGYKTTTAAAKDRKWFAFLPTIINGVGQAASDAFKSLSQNTANGTA
ncbi:MAG: type VI secretion system tip protein VgrG, partial [Desulfovibrio sp.]|nr:type VI secretion system tip protein VgrG [Desulfovibrio sp.]